MDDVKKYLAILQKHHFWVLAALLVIVGPLCWRAGASYLSEQAATNQATVDGKFSAAAGITGNPPNPTFTAVVDGMTDELKQQVLAAWEELYRDQKGLFKWPQAVESIGLLKLDAEIPEEIPLDLRIKYQNDVLEPEWQRILLTVNYRREKPIAAVAPIAPGGLFGQAVAAPVQEYEGVVQWDQAARDTLVARYRKTDVMTTLDIRVAQEDMWIYEALLKIIAKVNEGATEPHAAVIKRIDLLEIGSFAMNVAISTPGTYTTVAAAVTAAPTDGSEEDYYEPTTTSYTTPTFTQAPTGSNPVLAGRYLGASGEPIDATAPQPFAEFKQVFVDMKFAMDQRKVPELLAVCVNAPLPVEIRQVRIQSLASVEATADQGTAAVLGPQDAAVEVRGVIYMYNEPNAEKIGMGAAGAPPTQRPFGIPGSLY